MTFTEVLENEKAHELVDMIEELIGAEEPELVRIRTNLVNELKTNYGYEYKF